MQSNVIDIVTRFVDLALKDAPASISKELSADGIQTLFNLVTAAGFDPKAVVLGDIVRHYRDEDGTATCETYKINELCPFKVTNQDDREHGTATGWLDCAVRRVIYGATRKQEDRQALIDAMVVETERSVPLPPIQLTRDGDLLGECPPNTTAFALEYFVDHTRDERSLGLCAGVHLFCNGWMDRMRATATDDVIVCRSCHLRVLFPTKVQTYGDLRRALEVRRINSRV